MFLQTPSSTVAALRDAIRIVKIPDEQSLLRCMEHDLSVEECNVIAQFIGLAMDVINLPSCAKVMEEQYISDKHNTREDFGCAIKDDTQPGRGGTYNDVLGARDTIPRTASPHGDIGRRVYLSLEDERTQRGTISSPEPEVAKRPHEVMEIEGSPSCGALLLEGIPENTNGAASKEERQFEEAHGLRNLMAFRTLSSNDMDKKLDQAPHQSTEDEVFWQSLKGLGGADTLALPSDVGIEGDYNYDDGTERMNVDVEAIESLVRRSSP